VQAAPRAERKYDLILFGATGFTGKLCVEYLSNKYGDTDLKWAIAGRSKGKLEPLKEKEGKGKPDIVVADSTDIPAIKAMVAQTRVIITTAGPFARYGTPVVEACAELGTDYCDITGESPWVRDMIGLYDDKAKASGARIVHHCGHDCVPWDLMALMLSKKLRTKEEKGGEELKRVDMYNDMKGTFSGGTLETAMGLMFGAESKAKPKVNLGYDPLVLENGAKSEWKTTAQNVSCVTAGVDGRPARSMFFMAGVNANAVKRSNALMHYGKDLVYCEGSQEAGRCAAYRTILGFGAFGCLMACPLTRCCMLKYCLPKPGEGPTEEQMKAGYLTVTGVGQGASGGKAIATFHFPTDPGYRDTARMLVESGLTFVLEKDFKCEGGVYTPAACQGETLVNRLCATGSSFKYHDK